MPRIDPIFNEKYLKDYIGFIPNAILSDTWYCLINKITYNNDDAQIHFIVFDCVNLNNEHIQNIKWDPVYHTFSDYDTEESIDFVMFCEIKKPKQYDIDYTKGTLTPDDISSPISVADLIHIDNASQIDHNALMFISIYDYNIAMPITKIDNIVYLDSSGEAYTTIVSSNPEDNKYHISKAFKELIYRLGITSDQKLKLVNAIEDCCTKIRNGEDPDDPRKEPTSKDIFVTNCLLNGANSVLGFTNYTIRENVNPGSDYPHEIIVDMLDTEFTFVVNKDFTECYEVVDGYESNIGACSIIPYEKLQISIDDSVKETTNVELGFQIIENNACKIDINGHFFYGVHCEHDVYFFNIYFYIENNTLYIPLN